VRLALEKVGRTSITSTYEILTDRGELIANAKTVLVAYDYAKGEPVPITDDVRARLLSS
jgi:acyl-CoA thioesterase FadM